MITTDNPNLARLTQTQLSAQGLYRGPLDGIWGPKSEAAFLEYESRLRPGAEYIIAANDPPWLAVARKELGTSEIPGDRDNPRIVEYHSATTLKATDDETAWCSAFVNWCLIQSGQHGTNSAMARSFLHWGQALATPRVGCIVVFSRGHYPQGHVAFYVGRDNHLIHVLGGNQGNKVSIASYSDAQVLGYRWPR